MIPEKLLMDSGAQNKTFEKDELIFSEGQKAFYYYQLISGEVKMNNFHEDGKEFIQAIFSPPRSFGEPPLFTDIPYPANAVALKDSKLIQLDKESFFKMLKSNPKVHLDITEVLASRLYYKAIMASEISSQDPERRILRILDYLKEEIHHLQGPFSFKVDLTRQQIADLTGLRVETVIRTTKSLEKKNELKIKNRKLFR